MSVSTTTQPSSLEEAFVSAQNEFRKGLKDAELYDLTQLITAADVYTAAEGIQRKQAKTKTLRALGKIKPFIDGMKGYAAVIEVFVQVKPDIMGLIWGSLKLLLQFSSAALTTFESMIDILAEIGAILPQFERYMELFQNSANVRHVLCLFYKDLLDFFAITLNFISKKTRQILLESLWPNIRTRLDVVRGNIEKHKILMTSTVTLESIIQAQDQRAIDLQESLKQEQYRDRHDYISLKNEVSPYMPDLKLHKILDETTVESGEWLQSDRSFKKWDDLKSKGSRFLWMHGIPGAGKTFLTANLIRRLQREGRQVLFVLLSHEDKEQGNAVRVLHSLLFQALETNVGARQIVYRADNKDHRGFCSERSMVQEVLCDVIQEIGPGYIIIDGLDEIPPAAQEKLLTSLVVIVHTCDNTRFLLSSRKERTIGSLLPDKAIHLRVDVNNDREIETFVETEAKKLIREMSYSGVDDTTCAAVQKTLMKVARRSHGMFLYAKLMMHFISAFGFLEDIEREVENLPEGLNQAYGRLIDRIEDLQAPLRSIALRTLQWVVCAERPLREEELLRVLAIENGARDFGRSRKYFRDIRQICGPIIDVSDGVVHFVHFSAREYLLDSQSNNFVHMGSSQFQAASVSASYLSFPSLDAIFWPMESSDTGINASISNGDYVFFNYASANALQHIEHSSSHLLSSNQLSDLTEAVRLFLFSRFRTTSNDFDLLYLNKFKAFRGESELQLQLSHCSKFFETAQKGLWSDDDATLRADPLGIHAATLRLRSHLELMVCSDQTNHLDNCNCRQLLKMYGEEIYYCNRPFCKMYHTGFRTSCDRDEHQKSHERPFKCTESGCLFADVGFPTNSALSTHMSNVHPATSEEMQTSIMKEDLLLLREGDLKHILKDAVSLNQLTYVQVLFELETGVNYRTDKTLGRDLMFCGAWKASPAMVEYLFASGITFVDEWDKWDDGWTFVLAVAIEAQNRPNIKLAIEKGAKLNVDLRIPDLEKEIHGRSLPGGFGNATCLMRAFRFWDASLMEYLIEDCGVITPPKVVDSGHIFWAPVLAGADEGEAEERFADLARYITWDDVYDRGVASAVRSQSLIALRIALKYGGDPQHGVPELDGKVIGIWLQMAELLLQSGARLGPIYRCPVADMEKYFGITWDEISRRCETGVELPPGNIRRVEKSRRRKRIPLEHD